MFNLGPNNLEAEQGLLGALLVKNEAFDRITNNLKADHFASPAHGRIFTAILSHLDKGFPVDHITLKTKFEADGALEHVGGAEYLAELAASVVNIVNIDEYARIIKEMYVRRALIAAATEIQELAADPFSPNLLPETERIITAVTNETPQKQSTSGQAAAAALTWINDLMTGRITPTRTGIAALDERISGFYPGRLYVVGSRPGIGKTAFALSLADNIARTRPCFFISLEMKADELSMRLLAARTGIAVDRQQNPFNLDQHDCNALVEAQADISTLRLEILDAAGIDLGGIKIAARRHRRKYGEFVLFIDYLGLISMDKKTQNKVHQIEEITVGLKTLAKELNIPVVLLCQLSRALESRDDKTPMPSDLRDSGAIEQDADVIMFLHREEIYLERKQPVKKQGELQGTFDNRLVEHENELLNVRGKAEIILAKNRQGQRKRIFLNFDGIRQRFE